MGVTHVGMENTVLLCSLVSLGSMTVDYILKGDFKNLDEWHPSVALMIREAILSEQFSIFVHFLIKA